MQCTQMNNMRSLNVAGRRYARASLRRTPVVKVQAAKVRVCFCC